MRSVNVSDTYIVGYNGVDPITIKDLELASDCVGKVKELGSEEANSVLKVLNNETLHRFLRSFYESRVKRERSF